jgi:hypothetical protein
VDYSLQPFVDNFCTDAPAEAVPSFARTTMTQPGCYFVLTAPFARIIGLYSNTGEDMGVIGDDSTIGQDQIAFLEQQLAAALAARNTANAPPEALILTVHHPPFTGSSQNFPSAAMLAEIDGCCEQAGIWPDLVLSGHVHLYERYTRTMAADGREIAYVVAGNGGYYNLSTIKLNVAGVKPQPGEHSEPDGQGNTINLDQYNETDYGFLRITVSASEIIVVALGVDPNAAAGTAPSVIDSFIVNLTSHTVTTGSATTTNVTQPVKRRTPQREPSAGAAATHLKRSQPRRPIAASPRTAAEHTRASHAAPKPAKGKPAKRRG